jgi:hypothetical protein
MDLRLAAEEDLNRRPVVFQDFDFDYGIFVRRFRCISGFFRDSRAFGRPDFRLADRRNVGLFFFFVAAAD